MQVIAETKRSQLKLRKQAREAAGKLRAKKAASGAAKAPPKAVHFAEVMD